MDNNINILDELHKGCCMGIDALNFILPKTEETKFKDLLEERKKYISQTDRTKQEMDHRSIESYNKITIESINNYRRKHILKIKNNKKIKSKISLEKRKCTPDIGKKNFYDLNYENKNYQINLPFLNYSILKANKTIIIK